MGWDNRFKRVLITKKDYIPVGNPSEYQFRGGRFYRNGQAVELQDTSHFTDVSFTVGYNCLKGEWNHIYPTPLIIISSTSIISSPERTTQVKVRR